jgi:hypothetical protein
MRTILLSVLMGFVMCSYAQEPQPKLKRVLDPNLFFGGNLSLAFGDITQVDVSPLIGYRLYKSQLSVGAGLTYQYFSDNRYALKYNVYGGRLFAEFSPERMQQFLLHAEYEILYLNVTGYKVPIGNRSFMSIMALWCLNSENPLYQNPIIRVGYNF